MSDTQFSVVPPTGEGQSAVPAVAVPVNAADNGDINNFDDIPTDDRRPERMPIPEWGNKAVYIKPLSANDAIRFSMLMADPQKKYDAQAKLLQFALVNSRSEPLVPEARFQEFKERNVAVFNRLSEYVLVKNGFKDPKKAEEAAKNV
jgi:hypothetical protein